MSFSIKQKVLFGFSLILGLIIFIQLGKVIGWEEIGEAFSVFTGWQGLVIIFLSFLIAAIGNWRWQEILKDSGTKVSFFTLFKIYLGGYSMMYLMPILIWGGEAFRVYGLTKEKDISWKKTFASVIIERILEWTANILIIFLGLAFFLYNVYLPPQKLVIIFGASLTFFVFCISYFYIKALGKKSIIRDIVKRFWKKEVSDDNGFISVENDVFKYFQWGKSFNKGVALSILRALVMQLRVWILIIFLGHTIGFFPSLSILGFSYLSSMIPIPTSLGSHEAIQYYAFTSLGLLASTATVFTLIIRAAEVIVSSIGMMFLLRTGFKLAESKIFNYDKSK
ncbi:MAG TPA: lysylphosphatidylglycerol synthase transmembrane domain-containing protein [Candidatus Pacearchaeota archaeon]|nr:lysylphosphatidylglycerol synthase transmembrane domain-containing protein [Candidatus Pacearchaeota archaeon]HPR79827.1 lysylphosphatidylglycerol synthase transmembrane domain-containing protein [Candidatus Pacearchaeota archaeon]